MKDTFYTEMLRESQNRIRTMALIHENLYQSEDLSHINFPEYIRTLTYGLVRSYKEGTQQVSLTFDIDNVNLGVDAAIPCGLIINELVTNSLKHAFPHGRRGEIAVSCHSTGGAIEFSVRDNGVGIPEGVDFRNSGSLGLHLVTILAEDQLNGRITLSRKRGTEFCITFRSNNGG
jgi:two-component sensor histidine kinase